MANWIKELNITKSWNDAKIGKISTIKLSKKIVEKLKRIKYDDNELNLELEDIIYEFESFISEKNDDKDEFDYILGQLYDMISAIRM